MAGDIDNSDTELVLVRSGENQLREPEFNADTARLLLRQAIGINSSKRFDQRALAMIDMAGGCENEMFFCHLGEN